MKVYPFNDCVTQASKFMEDGFEVHQQWNCQHCLIKQTMEEPNAFFTRGTCENCGKETDIRLRGCNYMLIAGRRR